MQFLEQVDKLTITMAASVALCAVVVIMLAACSRKARRAHELSRRLDEAEELLKTEVLAHQATTEDCTALRRRLEKTEARVEPLQRKLDELKASSKTVEDRVAKAIAEASEARAELAGLEGRHQAKCTELESLLSQHQSLSRENDRLLATNKALVRKVDQIMAVIDPSSEA